MYMNKDINWNKIVECTLEERQELLPYIDNLLDLKHNFEKYGVYGFNDYFNSGNLFEKAALNLIIQGYMPDIFKDILYNLLFSSTMKNFDYLRNVIFAEFILMIQQELNNSDQLIKRILISYLGVECAKDFHDNPLEINSQ